MKRTKRFFMALIFCIVLVICGGCDDKYSAVISAETSVIEESALNTQISEEAAGTLTPSTQNATNEIAVNDGNLPTFKNNYSEAVEAYREFLLGQRADAGALFYRYYKGGAENAEFTLVDINSDGIPELHFRTDVYGYTIYTYRDDRIIYVESFQSEAVLLNNLAVYSDYWAHRHPWSATRKYAEFGDDSETKFSINFGYNENEETNVYRIMYNGCQDNARDVTKEEFEAITAPIMEYCTDPKNYDMIIWTNFGEWVSEHQDEYIAPPEGYKPPTPPSES